MSAITESSILRVLREKPCLDLRRLSQMLGVRPHDEAFARSVRRLLLGGRIHRISGSGRRASFVITSFEQ